MFMAASLRTCILRTRILRTRILRTRILQTGTTAAALPTVLALSGALALMAGCAQKPKGMPDLAPVSGVVTLDGKPLPKVTVAFTNDVSGQVSFGGTDDSGKFELMYSGRHKGASIGMNTVRITTSTENPVGPEWKDPVPAKYNKKTELKAEVLPGGTLIDFELSSK